MLDFDRIENNDWLAVNQFTIVEDKHNRRTDVVVFVNGMPTQSRGHGTRVRKSARLEAMHKCFSPIVKKLKLEELE